MIMHRLMVFFFADIIFFCSRFLIFNKIRTFIFVLKKYSKYLFCKSKNIKPNDMLEEYMLPCMMKKTFGVECLGCGMQRAIALLLRGDLVASFKMYPALYPMLLLGGVIITGQFINLKYQKQYVLILGITIAVFMVANYVWKHFI